MKDIDIEERYQEIIKNNDNHAQLSYKWKKNNYSIYLFVIVFTNVYILYGLFFLHIYLFL
jgi:hypothetical protein